MRFKGLDALDGVAFLAIVRLKGVNTLVVKEKSYQCDSLELKRSNLGAARAGECHCERYRRLHRSLKYCETNFYSYVCLKAWNPQLITVPPKNLRRNQRIHLVNNSFSNLQRPNDLGVV
jgi:hypothetical protein